MFMEAFLEIFLIAIGLSADAFAVSLSCGASEKKLPLKFILFSSAMFGFFQFLTPILGYFFGNLWAKQFFAFGHWISFVLLVGIGGKMIFEALQNESSKKETRKSFTSLTYVLLLAVVTAIDAFAVGISFSFQENIKIFLDVLIIGVTTFIISFSGFFTGRKFGDWFGEKAEILGGIVLVAIGIKIVIGHFYMII
jgi:putative Mn2+ efflux pump MntP